MYIFQSSASDSTTLAIVKTYAAILEERGTKKPKLGTGARFRSLQGKLSKQGARNPGALAAFIGRKKFGSTRFAKLSVRGRRRKSRKRAS